MDMTDGCVGVRGRGGPKGEQERVRGGVVMGCGMKERVFGV